MFESTLFNQVSEGYTRKRIDEGCEENSAQNFFETPIMVQLVELYRLRASTHMKVIPYICHFFYTGKIFGE